MRYSGHKYNVQHLNNVQRYLSRNRFLFNQNIERVTRIYAGIQRTEPFNYKSYPDVAKMIERELQELANNLFLLISNGIGVEWALANNKNDEMLRFIFGKRDLPGALERKMMSRNFDALKAFRNRVENDLTLSQRVWQTVKIQGTVIEQQFALGIYEGTPASQIAESMRRYLIRPDEFIRRIEDVEGKLRLSAPVTTSGGRGVYKSPYKNALRLTRTEINKAYHRADNERWMGLDFVTGIEVRRSGGGYDCDICESLAGVYPKNIFFEGWHPNCYDKKTEVYTKYGWKYFKDIKPDDKILSLNTETHNLEYSNIKYIINYHYIGDMYHFYSRNFDLLVTPDHPMLLQKKNSNEFVRISAREYYDKLLPIPSRNIYGSYYKNYRVAEWKGIDVDFISIGKYDIPTDLYCELMGYYISEGSFSRKYAVIISQSIINKENYERISECLNKLPFKTHKNKSGFSIYNEDLYNHVIPFGKSHEKYVPDVIKELSSEYIRIFLDAYNLGDGNIKKGKKWKGGNFRDILSYSTSSKKLASDVGELILKVGRRPTYSIMKTKGVTFKHRNGNYVSNHDIIIITEAYSKTAIQLNKEIISYDGHVYDLELTKNHTMYIRRNGKCTWGSNCMCFAIPILADFDEVLKNLDNPEPDYEYVTETSGAYKEYVKKYGDEKK
jgi:intein/homing endonuclease